MRCSLYENMDQRWRKKSRRRLDEITAAIDSGKPDNLSIQRIARISNDILSRFGNEVSVLDVGCGMGHGVYYMRRAGLDAVGCDLSEDAIQYCSKLGVSAHLGGVYELVDKYDVVVMTEVLEHLQWPERALSVLEGTTSALYLSTPAAPERSDIPGKHGYTLHCKYHQREWSPGSLVEFIEGASLFRMEWQTTESDKNSTHIEALYLK